VRISEEFVDRRHDAAWHLRMVTQLDGLLLRMVLRPVGDKAVDRGALLLTLGAPSASCDRSALGRCTAKSRASRSALVTIANDDPG
jgi:hypothetical protein